MAAVRLIHAAWLRALSSLIGSIAASPHFYEPTAINERVFFVSNIA
jgi:hypothetical protein